MPFDDVGDCTSEALCGCSENGAVKGRYTNGEAVKKESQS
jgi:hypothetical protein